MHSAHSLLTLLLVSAPLGAQILASSAPRAPQRARAESAAVPVAIAVRAENTPVIDGREDDDVWKTAQVVDGFRVFDPKEDGDPKFRTVAKVAYDDRNIYVLVRSFDPHPDSISALLSRRDQRTASDNVRIMIDSYHDKRTGYEFVLNPAGVQRDISITNDGDEDVSWDAVWQSAARVDSAGWVAEFRIPLSQLRFADAPEHTFGIMITREVLRTGERYAWPLYSKSRGGLPSQFAELQGLRALASPQRLEVVPYSVAKNVTRAAALRSDYSHPLQASAGLDVKYGLSSNLTLDATVNPDFGQVEADPAVLNLSAFETFFEERRPFFLEGTGIFRFDMSCNDGACRGLFYSRRIGRSPQLSGDYGDATTPAFSTILGAAKVTGRFRNGLSVGVLDAVTQREMGTLDRTVEPSTNFAVARVQQELRGGNSGIGVMATGTNRKLDRWTESALRDGAYTGGADFWHRFGKNNYQLGGFFASSQVTGSAAAIARTQRSSVHNYQRPDVDLGYDTTRTALGGYSASLGLNKRAGGVVRFYTGYTRTSPGFEINDVGFLPRADEQSYSTWVGIQSNNATKYYRRAGLNVNQWNGWTSGGLPTGRGGNVNFHMQLPNFYFVNAGYGLGNLGEHYDDRAARGGPALRQSRERFMWVGISQDDRKKVAFGAFMFHNAADAGRSWTWDFGPRVEVRPSSRVQGSLNYNINRRVQDAQWNGNFGARGSDTTHYTFARLGQVTHSVTTRFDFTATRTLSLQFYAQPFVTKGDFSDWRELATPRAAEYSARFRPFTLRGDPGDFDYKQFRTNTVVRWQYRPGSALFVVWQQGREQAGRDPGSFEFGRDYRNLFRTYPDNTFLVKASYWWGR